LSIRTRVAPRVASRLSRQPVCHYLYRRAERLPVLMA
jgi:hypothetical protein